MSEIKNIIQALCQILECCNVCTISKETFRQAKFDNKEAFKPMLLLLAKLLFIRNRLEIDKECFHNIDCMPSENLIKIIKLNLMTQGYYDLGFINMSSDDYSSRDILLAIGWLMSRFHLIDLILKIYFSRSYTATEMSTEFCQKDYLKSPDVLSISNSDIHQYIQWFYGRVKFSLHNFYAAQHSWAQLMSKVHQYTLGVDGAPNICHLSVMHVYLLKNKNELQKFMDKVDKENICLEAYGRWKTGEEVFWHWMMSLITLRDSNALKNEQINSKRGCIPKCHPPVTDNLLNANHSDIFIEDRCINLSPKGKKNSEKSASMLFPPCQFSYSFSSCMDSDSAIIHRNKHLENLIFKLEKEIEENRNKFIKVLQNIRLKDVICILPKPKEKPQS